MAKLSSFLFGKEPGARIETRPTMTPEQQASLRALLAQLEGTGVTPFEGELVAGLGDLEGLSLEALEQKILQGVQRTGTEAEVGTALTNLLKTGGAPVDFEDYFQSAVRDPAVQEFREIILPELTRRFGSSGAFGSDRRLAEQQATERLMRVLTGARSELSFRTRSDAANRLVQALGVAPGVESGSVENLLKLMQGAALPRSIQQARLTSEYGEFQRRRTQEQQRIANILASLGLRATENISQVVPGSTGIIQSTLQGAGWGRGSKGFLSG